MTTETITSYIDAAAVAVRTGMSALVASKSTPELLLMVDMLNAEPTEDDDLAFDAILAELETRMSETEFAAFRDKI